MACHVYMSCFVKLMYLNSRADPAGEGKGSGG